MMTGEGGVAAATSIACVKSEWGLGNGGAAQARTVDLVRVKHTL
jgi:hypothetical protein